MFFLSRPSAEKLRATLSALREAPFTHADVGLTRRDMTTAPSGFVLDRYSTELGHGAHVFARAREALSRLENYPESFTEIVRTPGELASGHVFGTLAHHLGFWSLHPCRVIYVIDQTSGDETVFGFGFGTLPGHAEIGEERFLIRWSGVSDEVCYDVQAFSRPGQLLTKLGAPVTRSYQRRFQKETVVEMRRRSRGV